MSSIPKNFDERRLMKKIINVLKLINDEKMLFAANNS